MMKTILTFGVISGVISAAMLIGSVPQGQDERGHKQILDVAQDSHCCGSWNRLRNGRPNVRIL
jgi:hypothetical protein